MHVTFVGVSAPNLQEADAERDLEWNWRMRRRMRWPCDLAMAAVGAFHERVSLTWTEQHANKIKSLLAAIVVARPTNTTTILNARRATHALMDGTDKAYIVQRRRSIQNA